VLGEVPPAPLVLIIPPSDVALPPALFPADAWTPPLFAVPPVTPPPALAPAVAGAVPGGWLEEHATTHPSTASRKILVAKI
jgi:hypothetical protein